jgi:hypothetical protein
MSERDPIPAVPASEDEPGDPVAEVVAQALEEVVSGATVVLTHTRAGAGTTHASPLAGSATATAPGPDGWDICLTVHLERRVARMLSEGSGALAELLDVLPAAGVRTVSRLRDSAVSNGPVPPSVRRAVRDALAAEIVVTYLCRRLGDAARRDLVAETIEYLIELSGTRVEAHELTHGVIVTDVLEDEPRLELRYPDDLRPAKRAPLLFDGQRSVLVVDPAGRARTELQRHRFDRLGGGASARPPSDGWMDSGWLVGLATRTLGGVGFFVRADRTIWTFVDGQPLLVRRGEHWTAFPVELATSISNMIGGGAAAGIVARAAYLISARPQGAILAIVDDPSTLDGVVSLKDRYDLRNEIDPEGMRPETRLHHLMDADDLDEHTLARLAALDGATIVDRDAGLIAYGAIVTSADSEHEGARTAAARTLSETALVVLRVSVDGDITIFRDGAAVTTLLGNPGRTPPED